MIEDSTYKTLAFYVYRVASHQVLFKIYSKTQKLKASKLMMMMFMCIHVSLCIFLSLFHFQPSHNYSCCSSAFPFFLNIKCKSGLILLVPLLHYLICLSCFFLFLRLCCVLCCVCVYFEDDADDEEDDMTRKYNK